MKTKFAATALILASGLLMGSQSFAEVTREQVKAELAAAVGSGAVMANGETGAKFNEVFPSRYAASQAQSKLTREQVKAELAQALRTGDYFVGGEVSVKCNELHPGMHPAV